VGCSQPTGHSSTHTGAFALREWAQQSKTSLDSLEERLLCDYFNCEEEQWREAFEALITKGPLPVQEDNRNVNFHQITLDKTLQGYGELKGQSIHLDMDGLPPDPAGDAFCVGHGQYWDTALWRGYILSADS
jgi:hypothetical protein